MFNIVQKKSIFAIISILIVVAGIACYFINGGFNLDPMMLLKLQKIMSLSGKNDDNDKAKLLLSLKPFLKDERKNKVDKAVQLMNISKIISIFKDEF